MVAESDRATDGSTAVGVARSAVESVRVWLAASWLAGVWAGSARDLGVASSQSTLARAGRRLGRYVRNAALYRWLTTDPDPDVIVIDLRDTYAVGPLVALLDRVGPVVERVWLASGLRELGAETTTALRDAPIRAVSFVAALGVFANTALVGLAGSLSTEAILVRVVALGLALAGTRITAPWDALARARSVRLLRAALEPPEPPDRPDRE
ncbi:DUF945 domain-containing protein [Halorussus marinus]|uniref:DUF945 domain-containing protein n=1 Tax=Halorussus marinus TaxID=2505976 RepID=UPI001092AE66|nr:DUF945 domain-containing protein [Halorussus marinus]